MSAKLRSLLFSTLYPSSTRPNHGIFVETRLRELLQTGKVEAKVVAPVPWIPKFVSLKTEHDSVARTPHREIHNSIDVLHPRYPLIPKIGMNAAPFGLALGALPAIRRLLSEGFDFDVIDAHYFYPDGVAAALIGKWLHKPFTITARGSDLTLLAKFALPRFMMRLAARHADASIGVCAALVDSIRGWGIESHRLHVMRNGVDLNRFHPRLPSECRTELGLGGSPILISVGHLIPRKGHDLVIEALFTLRRTYPQAMLVIAGDGPLRSQLEEQAAAFNLADNVKFVGAIPQSLLVSWYSAADVLVLASSHEGWANVLLEALACGTPVVATNVDGTPEVISDAIAGRLVSERNAASLAGAIHNLLESAPDRALVRQYAEHFDWETTTLAQLKLFANIADSARARVNA